MFIYTKTGDGEKGKDYVFEFDIENDQRQFLSALFNLYVLSEGSWQKYWDEMGDKFEEFVEEKPYDQNSACLFVVSEDKIPELILHLFTFVIQIMDQLKNQNGKVMSPGTWKKAYEFLDDSMKFNEQHTAMLFSIIDTFKQVISSQEDFIHDLVGSIVLRDSKAVEEENDS